MKSILKIQYYLREFGLDSAIDKFKILAKPKGNLVLFKYNQLESDFTIEEVQECRGLILDSSNNWEVICYPFKKFFNIQEQLASNIDWNTSKIFTKLDGSLISFYFYNNEWNISTSGVLDGSSTVNSGLESYRDLVIETIKLQYNQTLNEFTQILNPLYYYMFELCTPKNIVVTPHQDSKLYLLSMRNSLTLQEECIELMKPNLLIAPNNELLDIDSINKTFDTLSWKDEGYVVCDSNFNRVKIKNPAYLIVHHTRTGSSPYYIMDIIKSNEIDEYCSYFKERETEAIQLRDKLNNLEYDLNQFWEINLNKGIGYISQKEYALEVLNSEYKEYSGLFFNLKNNKLTIREYLCNINNKVLYNILNDNN